MWDVLPQLDHGAAVHMLREAHRVLLPGGCVFVERLPARRPCDRGDRRRRRADRLHGPRRDAARRRPRACRRRTRSGCWTASPRSASSTSASATGRGPGAPTGARRSTSSSRGCERGARDASRRGRPRADRRPPPRARARHLLRADGRRDRRSRAGVAAARRCSRRSASRVPRAILLTHIHFDHAGATGALVRRWPDVEVWVHERGAPHVIDPSKLVASATRLYGDDMARLWGEVVPVPERNVRVLRGGERIGPWQVEYAPGHAQHHVVYLHEPTRTAFCGDVAGVQIGGGPVLPPTPPPDIDLDAWSAVARHARRLGAGAARADALRARRGSGAAHRRAAREPRALRVAGARARRRRSSRTRSAPSSRGSADPQRRRVVPAGDAAGDAVGGARPLVARRDEGAGAS